MRLAPSTLLHLLLLVSLAGCADLNEVQTTSDHPRVGNVYLVRGLIGIWSFGMDGLADQLQAQGVRAVVYQDAQTSSLARQIDATYRDAKGAEPLVLVGHSLGADDVLTISQHLDRDHIPIDLLITLDPVSPSAVPPNVRRAVNFYKSNGVGVPIFRGVALTAANPTATRLENLDLRTNRHDLDPDGNASHFNIDDNETVRAEVVRLILTVTPPRNHLAPTRPPA